MSVVRIPKDDDLLAAEYALGVLTGETLVAARQRARQDRDFGAAVTEWEIRFTGLAEDLVPQTPSPAVKAALFAKVSPPTAAQPLWRRVWVWQALSIVSVLALAILLVFDAPQPGPLYTAEIAAEAGDFRVVAVVDKSTNEVIMTRTQGGAPEGRILQVWAHGEDAPAISVGLWTEGETVRLPMPPVIAAVEGVLTLGVSEEPPGGSLTGSPSGRVFGTVDIPGVTATR